MAGYSAKFPTGASGGVDEMTSRDCRLLEGDTRELRMTKRNTPMPLGKMVG